MGILGNPRHNLRSHARIARPHEPLFSSGLHVGHPCLPVTGVRLRTVADIVPVHVARCEHDGLWVQVECTQAPLVQQWMQRVTHVVVGLGPLVDHDDLRHIEVQTKVIGRVEVQRAGRVVGYRHARLTHIGVWPVDVDLAKPSPLNQYVLNSRFANARLALQVYAVVTRVEQEVDGLYKVDAPCKFDI